MIYYIYDGSFDGLLSAVYEGFQAKKEPAFIVKKDNYQPDLFSQIKEISTEEQKVAKISASIKNKLSNATLNLIYYAYLSEIKGVETAIYDYLKLAFKEEGRINHLHSNQAVLKVNRSAKKVKNLAQQMKELLNFKALDNRIYYATITAEYNIIPLVATHFAQQFSEQNWIIHDLQRESAAIYNQKEWTLTKLRPSQINLAKKSNNVQQLWQDFFNSISINSRENFNVQKDNIPKRCWDFLVEKARRLSAVNLFC